MGVNDRRELMPRGMAQAQEQRKTERGQKPALMTNILLGPNESRHSLFSASLTCIDLHEYYLSQEGGRLFHV